MAAPHLYINPPFQGYHPFLAKFLVPPQVTQFFEAPTPSPLIREGGSNYDIAEIPQME